MIKRAVLLIFLVVLFLPSTKVNAETEDFLNEQYKISGAENLDEYLPESTREFLNESGITPDTKDWGESLNPKNVFLHIWSFLKSGAKKPLALGAVILSLTLISAAIGGMGSGGAAMLSADFAVSLSVAVAVISPLFSVITAGLSALQGCTVFMTAFIPVFAVIVVSAGQAATSVSMSGLLLGATEAVGMIADFAVMPLMSGYLAISISAGVSPLIQKTGIADGIKKLCYWTMSLLTTVFLGILSLQTAVNASADTLTLKTAKFIIGSSVAVAGTALSEALSTVTASMGILKTTVGIYGVIALAALFLPLLAEMLLWRVSFNITAAISDLLAVPKISNILRSADTVLSVMIGLILLTCALFIISLSVVISTGRAG